MQGIEQEVVGEVVKANPSPDVHSPEHLPASEVTNIALDLLKYGSGIVVEGAGFLLNNEMDDFSAEPGPPNLYGLVGAGAKSIQPNKRPLSSMSPTIAVQNSKVALVLGTPGGSRIFTSVYQVLVNTLDYKLPLAEAQAQHMHLLPQPSQRTHESQDKGWRGIAPAPLVPTSDSLEIASALRYVPHVALSS